MCKELNKYSHYHKQCLSQENVCWFLVCTQWLAVYLIWIRNSKEQLSFWAEQKWIYTLLILPTMTTFCLFLSLCFVSFILSPTLLAGFTGWKYISNMKRWWFIQALSYSFKHDIFNPVPEDDLGLTDILNTERNGILASCRIIFCSSTSANLKGSLIYNGISLYLNFTLFSDLEFRKKNENYIILR